MNNHEEKVKEANDAINAVFGDTSVLTSQTRESLEELRDNIDTMLETLSDD